MIETRDLWIASFLIEHGKELEGFEVISPGRSRFTFDLTREEYDALKLLYHQSVVSKIKQIQQHLKDLSY